MEDELLEALSSGMSLQDMASFEASTRAATAELQILNTRLFPQASETAKKKSSEDE